MWGAPSSHEDGEEQPMTETAQAIANAALIARRAYSIVQPKVLRIAPVIEKMIADKNRARVRAVERVKTFEKKREEEKKNGGGKDKEKTFKELVVPR